MEKITFVKKTRKFPNNEWPRIRVNKEIYKAVADIADETNIKMSDVTNQLIVFALKHVQIVREDEE